MDKEAHGASGFEHGTVAGVLWQKGALGFAARSQADSGPERVGKEPYFHLRSIAPSKRRDVPLAATQCAIHQYRCEFPIAALLEMVWPGRGRQPITRPLMLRPGRNANRPGAGSRRLCVSSSRAQRFRSEETPVGTRQ